MKRIILATAVAVACCSTALADYTPGSLMAYWPLDETNAAETTVADESGNGNDGARRTGPFVTFPAINGPIMNTNGPTINTVQKNAAAFDGSNDILFVAHDASLNSAASQGAISFWVNTDVDARQAVLHQQDPGDGTLTGFALEKSGSGVQYAIYFTPNVDSDIYFMSAHDPTPNTWEHYVFSWDVNAGNSGDNTDPNRIKCFVNGSPVLNFGGGGTVDTGFTVAPTLGNLVFGRRFYDAVNSRPFDGEMAEIALFDATVDATKAMGLFTTGVNAADPDLVAYYDFSEGSGTAIADDSANSNDMITSQPTVEFPISAVAGPQWAAAAPNGKPAYFDRALEFDGANDTVTFPDSASLDWNKSAGTVVMWLYGASATTRYGLLGSQNSGFQAETHSSTRQYFYPDGFNLYLPATGSRVANQWYHVAFVWDASEPVAADRWAMYYNGTFVANTEPHTFFFPESTNDWTMGRKAELGDTANPRWFDGQMADVAMFNEALGAADIVNIHINGVAAFIAGSEPPLLEGIIISDSGSGHRRNR